MKIKNKLPIGYIIVGMLCLISDSHIVFSSMHDKAEPEDQTQQYLDKKAVPAIIHDAYYEASPYNALPASFKLALEKFGYKDDEIQFYTAVRMNKFVERVGNNLIILRPNFFLYLTEAEQSAYIGLQLAALRAGNEDDVGGSHGTFYQPELSLFQKASIGATVGVLGLLYRDQLCKQWPVIKNLMSSKGCAVITSGLMMNIIKNVMQERDRIQKLTAAQNAVVDNLGIDGLLSIRTKQVHWAHLNYSWIINKWYQLLGKCDLAYNPETLLNQIVKYAASKNNK